MPREPKRDRKKTVTPPPGPKGPATVQPAGSYIVPETPSEASERPSMASDDLLRLMITAERGGIQFGTISGNPTKFQYEVVLDEGGHPKIEKLCLNCNHQEDLHRHYIKDRYYCTSENCECPNFIDPEEINRFEEFVDDAYGDILYRLTKGKITINDARRALGLPEYHVTTEAKTPEVNTRARILAIASDIINGDRAQVYGPPSISFNRIADIWNAMGIRIGEKTEDIGQLRELKGADVALVLIGMKLSRTIGAHDHEDNWIDLAGYAGLGAELSEGEKDAKA